LLLGYVAVFGVAAVACLFGAIRARRVRDRETRIGLVALLATSGAWAASHVGILVAPPDIAATIYLVGLIFGFSTVWEWLYFCSAYTGRGLHRDSTLRAVGLGAYLLVVAIKLTNPLHHAYFRTTYVQEPFPHLALQQGFIHWTVTGFSYALAAVGLFMLFELFERADYDTRGLVALVVATALPVAVDILGYAAPQLIDIIYAPLGVAVFALGVLVAFEDRFLAVQLTSDVDDPVLFLDDDGRLRDFNDPAASVLSGLEGARGRPLGAVAPDVRAALDSDDRRLTVVDGGETHYYFVTESDFAAGEGVANRVVVLTDVTETERQRRELERQNEQLEGFSEAVTHELRNALQLTEGYVSMATSALDDGDADAARERLRTVSRAADRMEHIVADLATLAQHGQTVETTAEVDFERAVELAWAEADVEGMDLEVLGEGTLRASPARLHELLASGFRFAAHNDAETVTVELADGTLTVTDDGNEPRPADVERYFDFGEAVPDAEAGMALPNVRALARVHGWNATLDTHYDGGARLVVGGVDAPAP
jgi:signal transduction histidine kinase